MNVERYDYLTGESFLDYEFYSDGPKGKIKKVVRFQVVHMPGYSFYNLGFGDWNAKEKTIDDFVVSNNQDAERVLATVASTVMDFAEHYPNAVIYIEGSTPTRTRRYQMGISKYWNEINANFEVYGLIELQGFQRFVTGMNYQAFIVQEKSINFKPSK